MKRFTPSVITSILILTINSVFAQDNESLIAPIKWHSYTQPGELMYFTEYKDKLVIERRSEGDNYAEPRLKNIMIVKRIDDSHYIVEEEDKEGFVLLKKVMSANNQVLDISFPIEGKTVENVGEQFENGVPIWKSLEAIRFYSQEKFQEVKKLPGLNEVKREDLIKSLQWRKPLGEMLEAYLKDSDGSRPYQIYRFLEAYQKKKFVELGYNPYKMIAYNFEKQFAGDEEIIKLLTEEITFD
ncbi:hypothetical protein MTsPCn9_06000 [Croceitalea sp. MTPC9]|uniref:hypothetical protein n=1 Tax=unclassified Croceitalea TaxID=2632280 RepID=UPI002B3B352F|nr:hypothetical protein MTsPCn6_02710 [Croceitalea sp. MTPC6]GMN15664.1 hypothetical protein MTsPCn9_06000 [Croceitalea sp. MTPC9]